MTQPDSRFAWVDFYEEFADRLLKYMDRDKRGELLQIFRDSLDKLRFTFPLHDRFPSDRMGPLNDIDPFTVMGAFNRSRESEEKRASLAGELGKRLRVSHSAPTTLDGIPTFPQVNSKFFDTANLRESDDIDKLWNTFAVGIEFADHSDSRTKDKEDAFISAYDQGRVRNVGHRLATGLYWARPRYYPTLDKNSRRHIRTELGIPLPEMPSSGSEYLELRDQLDKLRREDDPPFWSFPELSRLAWIHEDSQAKKALQELDSTDVTAERQTRREQRYLRQSLFKGEEKGRCAICGETFWVESLVAAHKKKRSKCNEEERRNPNIVMPLCVFGCDYLYEKRYVRLVEGVVKAGVQLKGGGAEGVYRKKVVGKKVDARWLQGDPAWFS